MSTPYEALTSWVSLKPTVTLQINVRVLLMCSDVPKLGLVWFDADKYSICYYRSI